MEFLKNTEVSEEGYYWKFNPVSGDSYVVDVRAETDYMTYMFCGSECEQLLRDEHDCLFIKIETPEFKELMPKINLTKQWEDHQRLNSDSRFPHRVEGYWRNSEVPPTKAEPGKSMEFYNESQTSSYPWPVVINLPGFDVQDFINHLADVEDDLAKEKRYRGFSICRLTGVNRGCAEYEYEGWKWPGGYLEYIRLGVLPSRAFYKFIMGDKAKTRMVFLLPTYNREIGE